MTVHVLPHNGATAIAGLTQAIPILNLKCCLTFSTRIKQTGNLTVKICPFWALKTVYFLKHIPMVWYWSECGEQVESLSITVHVFKGLHAISFSFAVSLTTQRLLSWQEVIYLMERCTWPHNLRLCGVILANVVIEILDFLGQGQPDHIVTLLGFLV